MTGSTLPARPVSTQTIFDETVATLGGFRSGYPKFYSIADLKAQSRRRWVPLERAVDSGRVELMFRNYFTDSGDIRFSTYLVAEAFTHGSWVVRSRASSPSAGFGTPESKTSR